MVDLAHLERRARRAAERGRLVMASRVALAVVPVAALAICLVDRKPVCCALAGVLLAACIAMRWHSRTGLRAARFGLAMGLLPLAFALYACGCDPACEPSSFARAQLACVAAGALAGIGVALTSRSSRDWAGATVIASLTASLGCVDVGAGGILLAIPALITAGLLVRIPLAMRAT